MYDDLNQSLMHYFLKTRMHSSRMRTARSLTASRIIRGACVARGGTSVAGGMHGRGSMRGGGGGDFVNHVKYTIRTPIIIILNNYIVIM